MEVDSSKKIRVRRQKLLRNDCGRNLKIQKVTVHVKDEQLDHHGSDCGVKYLKGRRKCSCQRPTRIGRQGFTRWREMSNKRDKKAMMLSKTSAERSSEIADTMSSTGTKEPPSLAHVDDNRRTKGTVSARAATSMDLKWPLLPWPRGPLSSAVISAFRREPGSLGITPPVTGVDALSDDDFALALYLCYEVHYRGATNYNWEWDSDLLRYRAELEKAFEDRLRDEIAPVEFHFPFEVATVLDETIRASPNPSLSNYLLETGTLEQFRELCVHRSAYRLKEADPHTFGIPRLSGEAKAAMVAIQYDEYGSGEVAAMHSTLFGETMGALGLDSSYGSYVEVLPGVTLSTVNLVSMFALHRRWRAALVGHLAVFEMTSVGPMGQYSRALERFGIGSAGRRFYDVHVIADKRHGQIARDRMVTGLIRAEPELAQDLYFGVTALLMLERRFSTHLLEAWAENRSSLVPWGLPVN